MIRLNYWTNELTDRDFVFVQDNQAKMWDNYLEESKEECVMNMN